MNKTPLQYAYDSQTCDMQFAAFEQIYAKMKRQREIDALGLSGLSDRMYQKERQEYRDIDVWLRSREIFWGDGMKSVYIVINRILDSEQPTA